MKKLIDGAKGGFTLIELLVVVGILGILAVAALVAINPAEAQRKARDTQRIKDLGTMQNLLEQYIGDNINTVSAITKNSTQGTDPKNCGTTGWMGLSLCSYANTLPVDPANRMITVTTAGGSDTSASAIYKFTIDSDAQYRVCVRLESKANAAKLTQDGVSNNWLEVYSSTAVSDCDSF